MANERNIGRIVTVDSLSVYVRLDDDLKSLYKSGYEEIYPVARINSYIVIPVGADKIVAMVNRVMTREETDLTKSSGTIFLTKSLSMASFAASLLDSGKSAISPLSSSGSKSFLFIPESPACIKRA